jgi:putative nucleotidyltransferase with HDIG domain
VTSLRELTARQAYTPLGGESSSFLKVLRTNLRSVVWAAVLTTGALATIGLLASRGYSLPQWWILLGLGLVAGLAERHSVPLLGDRQRGIEMSVSFVPFVFTAVAFGPLAALLVGTLGNLADLRRPYLKWAVYTPARALTGAAAGLAASWSLADGATSFIPILVAVVFAGLAHLTVDAAINMSTLAIRGSASPLAYPKAMAPLFMIAIPLYMPLVAFLVYGYQQYSPAIVATFLVPVLALQRVAHLYQEQREATRGMTEAYGRLEQANISFAAALVATLDARDRYTAGHSAAVAVYSRDIAGRMGLSEAEQQQIHVAGLVHDIGKIGLPPGLLEKEGPLTLEERRSMQTHSEIGERILANIEDYRDIADIVRHHHERMDGHGYPDGLSSDEIPLMARIIAVADAYNAMTSDRPYREAMPSRVARMRLAQAVGSQFDTTVVAAFEAILATANEAYRVGQTPDFAFLADQPESPEPLALAIAGVA